MEKYKKEMLEMYKKSTSQKLNNTSLSPESGKLTVNVTTLRELYPLPNAKVTVFIGPYENMTVIDTDLTDESGKTKIFSLPAPDRSLSQSAGATEPVYTNYGILVEADGYTDSYSLNLPIFRGVTSLQSIDMTLLASSADGSAVINDEREEYNL